MNYDHLNKVHDYWVKEILPNLSHHIAINSFDDYLKQMSILPCGKWLKEFDSVKIVRVPFSVDPAEFSKVYKEHCVAYCCPSKPEDGLHRIIYQLSPTFHIESAVWIWVENEIVQSYMSLFICFKDREELLKFFDAVLPMRRTGNTEENPMTGFAGLKRS